MTGEHIEIIVEFSVILLAPIIHNYYLWKVKKVDSSVIQQNIKIFSFFYVLIAIGVALLLTTPKVQANESHCYSIQNADTKNSCLAQTKNHTVTQYVSLMLRICVLHKSRIRKVTVTVLNQMTQRINVWHW